MMARLPITILINQRSSLMLWLSLILFAYCTSLPYVLSSSSSSIPSSIQSISSKTHRLRGHSTGHSSRPSSYPTRSIPTRYHSSITNSSSNQPYSTLSSSQSQSLSSSSSTTKVHGAVDCIIAIHDEISWCNQSYYQSLTQVIIKGYRKESRVYRRQYCCGHWSLQRCIFTIMQRKCDQETYDKIRDARSMDWRNTKDYSQQQINCDDYEHNSPVCSSTKPTVTLYYSCNLIMILVIITIITMVLW
ncbi:hypothetical protein DERP_008420 [Dermatophagoides pteronyssinus]|nr:hypothetical protein DERP_008420 [Dermatophagoides pteronyssinus]